MNNSTADSRSRPSPWTRPARWLWILAVGAIYLVPFLSLDGALAVYLKIDEIEGEAKAKGHEGEIEIVSWGWGVERTSGGEIDRFRELSPQDVTSLVLTKRTDKSTAALLRKVFSGQHLDEATLTVAETGNDRPLEFLQIELKNVLVDSYENAGAAGNERLLETFGLRFDHIKSTYALFDSKDEQEGSSEVFWTISTNTGGGSTSTDGGGPPANAAPTISGISNQTIEEDGSATVSFTVGDSETPAGSLSLGRSSSNQALLPLSNIVFGGTGSSRTATLTPAPDRNGSSSVVITVSDGSKTASSSFTLTVDPVNDPPGIGPLGAQTTEAEVPLDLEVTVDDIDSNVDNLTLTGAADPAGLVSRIEDTSRAGKLRRLRIVPAPGATGTATITLTATDDASPVAGQTRASFSLTINPRPGEGPAAITLNGLDAGQPVPLEENLPDGTEVGVLDAIGGDPGLRYEFTLLDSAGGRFAIGGPENRHLLVANGLLLDFEKTPGHTIVIRASDVNDPARARSDAFRVDLQNVNEPPAITLPPGFGTTPPDTGFHLAGISIDDPDSGPEDIVVTFAVGDGVLTLDDGGLLAGKIAGNGSEALTVTAPVGEINAVLAANAGLVYRGDPSFAGTETLTVSTDDGGNTGLGSPQRDFGSATLEVEFTPWELWRRANFTAVELLDPGISSFTADPDRDGLANGGEYGVNSRPKDPGSGPDRIELVYVESGGESYPAIRFVRRASDPDYSISVEVATDLLNWVSGPAFTIEDSVTPIEAGFDQPAIRTFFPVSANPRQQIRLRFTLDSR